MIRTICGCIFITMVMCVPVFVKGGGEIPPDVIAVQGQHKNMSIIVQYLNTVVSALTFGVRNTFGIKNQEKIPCSSVSFETQSWSKRWRQIHKIKQNRFFYGMFYSRFFAIFYRKTSKFGYRVDGWVLAIIPKHFKGFLEIS